jgi:hypothetical protein
MIKSSNMMLLDIARSPKGKKEDFQDIIEQLKSFNYIVQMQMLTVRGFSQEVMLMRNLSQFD